MRATVLKRQKFDSNLFLISAVILFLAYSFGPSWIKQDFILGIAAGLSIMGLFYKIYHFTKRKDEHFEEDLELSVHDERIQIEKLRTSDKIKTIIFYEMILMVIVSTFYDFSFKVGGGILLWSYIIIAVGSKLIERYRK